MILIKSRRKVCQERAKKSADQKYDPLIKEKRDEYSLTKNVKVMQSIIKLSREKTLFQSEAFKYHMDNYEIGKDSLSNQYTESEKNSMGLKDFTDYLSEELSKIME